MPSEREIRKLYVNGRTICIEFFFLLISIFHRLQDTQPSRRGRSWGLGGISLNKRLDGTIRPKTQNIYMFALLAELLSIIFY